MSIAACVGRIGQLCYMAFWIEPPVLAQAARSICVVQGCEDARIENICWEQFAFRSEFCHCPKYSRGVICQSVPGVVNLAFQG
jgi:hypothetical protein